MLSLFLVSEPVPSPLLPPFPFLIAALLVLPLLGLYLYLFLEMSLPFVLLPCLSPLRPRLLLPRFDPSVPLPCFPTASCVSPVPVSLAATIAVLPHLSPPELRFRLPRPGGLHTDIIRS